MSDLKSWIEQHGVTEIECLVPDMNGVLRGKVLPAAKLLQSPEGALRMPSSVFSVTVTGEYADAEGDEEAHRDADMVLKPDASTLCIAPGFKTPTAFVFADAMHSNGEPWASSPRHVLKRVLELYRAKGWRAVVAPELEFYLTALNPDPDLPLTPPAGRSGRAETSPQPYGLEAITEYEDLIDDIYEYSEAASLHLDTMIHESGTAQLEINFLHGDPLGLADQVLVFKRIVRQVALKHGLYATFMAKPMEHQPGSAMHLHISVEGEAEGVNLFADDAGEDSRCSGISSAGCRNTCPRSPRCSRPTSTPSGGCGRTIRPRSMCSGATTTGPAACGCRSPTATTAASRTGCPAPTPTPTWR